ncbi:hypothetical protein EDB19DRAFT_228389 [Suillus lakei]|nr:hypothetical protein EDB19DRAFT_228389 [Suillus lakei]
MMLGVLVSKPSRMQRCTRLARSRLYSSLAARYKRGMASLPPRSSFSRPTQGYVNNSTNSCRPNSNLCSHAITLFLGAPLHLADSNPEANSMRTRRYSTLPSRSPLIRSLVEPWVGTSRSKFLGDALPPISEDDFHALGQHQLESRSHHEHLCTHYQGELHFCGDAGNVRITKPPSRAIEIVAPPQHLDSKCSPLQSHHRSQFSSRSHLSLRQQAQVATLPRSPLASNSSQHSYQHTDSRSNSLNSTITTSSTNDKPDSSPQNYLHSPQASRPQSDDQEDHRHNSTSVSSKAYVPAQKSPSLAQQLSFENDMRSPTLISPALTYSSRTPSTLSPATPFFGSFNGSPETFEYAPDDGEMVEKVKAGSSTH